MRHAILEAYWRDSRWREVILLAAGQLGVVDNRPYDAGLFLNDLRQLESSDPADAGRPTVLAGRGLADIGASGVSSTIRRDVMRELHQTMQDRDLETDRLHGPRVSCRGSVTWPASLARSRRLARRSRRLGAVPQVRRMAAATCSRPSTPSPTPSSSVSSNNEGYINPKWWGGEDSPGLALAHDGASPNPAAKNQVPSPRFWQRPASSARIGTATRSSACRGMKPPRTPRGWQNSGKLQIANCESGAVVNLEEMATQRVGSLVRLPTDAEWLRLTGGEKEGKKDRYPWDVPGSGRVTEYEKEEGTESHPGAGKYP